MKNVKRTLAVGGLLLGGALFLTGCGRNVDVDSTGAQPVPGARGLYRMCDGPTLIYFSHWDVSDDDYEAMWPGWCLKGKDGKWTYDPDTLPVTPATTNGNTDDGGDK